MPRFGKESWPGVGQAIRRRLFILARCSRCLVLCPALQYSWPGKSGLLSVLPHHRQCVPLISSIGFDMSSLLVVEGSVVVVCD
ncbi:hypothetical protein DQP56_00355 [Mycolicibacter senuensis]|uniref:Uncharacterized protein n=1 Tax=Mycolicibacter longobardus TaxID=1108812 RepID=A0A1X1YAK0_9MYCO|nr:hypothetical protein AWC16_20115 [Mycolicibacter longobardus]RAV04305.1 hypothetical protein DQP56_00355 [Mycolicibacter senuensis]